MAVLAHDVRLHAPAHAHLRHVAQVDRRVPHLLDRQVAERLGGIGAGVELHEVLPGAHACGARREDDVLRVERGAHVGRGERLGEERLRVDVDVDQARHAAVGRRHGHAVHGGERDADEVGREVAELRLGPLGAGDAELQDRDVGGVEADHERRRDAGRHLPGGALRRGGELRHPGRHVGVGLEVDLDDAQPAQRLRLDVLDVVDVARVHALGQGDDALLHLLRRQPVVLPDHRDHRDVDRREDVDRHAQDRDDAEDEQQQRRADERVRAPQREEDEPHGVRPAIVCESRTGSPGRGGPPLSRG